MALILRADAIAEPERPVSVVLQTWRALKGEEKRAFYAKHEAQIWSEMEAC